MRKNVLLTFFCLIRLGEAIGQVTIGLPAIRNYKNTDYHAAIEIWGIGQDKNNILYFANNDGLLSFDGTYWKNYPLPNKAAIRSLAIDDSGRIYAGGQDEVGYFFPDRRGILVYHSLKELLPPIARQFADIWDIVIVGKEVFFRTIETIFFLKNDRMLTFDAPGGWRLLTMAGKRLYAVDKTKGLLVFNNGQWEDACPHTSTASLHVTAVMDYKNDTLLVTTLRSGLYHLYGSSLTRKPTPVDPLLLNGLVRTARRSGEDRYAIGTNANGSYVIDHEGNMIQRLSNNEGLQNNKVLTIFPDHDKNLWLGLGNGVSLVNYNTPVRHIYPVRENQLMSNAVTVFDGKLFIGTSDGLYSVPLDPAQKDISTGKGAFTEVNNSKGQVWCLWETDHELLCGHQDGAFVIRDNRAIPLLTKQGVWEFGLLSPGEIIAGTYTGLQRIRYEKGEFKDEGKVSDLYESLGVLATEEADTGRSVIWASHPYRGVFKIPLSAGGGKASPHIQYTQKNGLPSDLNDFVFTIRHKMVVATGKGIYEYNAAAGRFIPSPFFAPIFGDRNIEYLKEDRSGNIWFISDQRVGVVDLGKSSGQSPFSIVYFPELDGQTVKGAGFIYPYDRENIFIGSNNGIYHLNYRQYINPDTTISVHLGAVKAIAEKDSLLFGGYFPENKDRLSNHWNSFHFEYSSPVYAQISNVSFSYKLEGFDKEWSDWSTRTEKDYTNLPSGEYAFIVKARNNLGNASQPVSYTFAVKPAWYQTVWAWLIYFFLAAYAVNEVLKRQQKRIAFQQRRHEEEQARLNYLHSLELDRKEKGIIALQNAKLEGELQFKDKELATVTMHLVERGGLLLTIKEELLAVIKRLNIPDLPFEFRSVFKLMSDTEKSDDDWQRFAIHFDQVHNNFLSTLKMKFPNLSPTDLKLCAYLRLNLTSKEIAQLLNISLKGVEVSRYRVRKKFNLPTETNLHDFLIGVTGHSTGDERMGAGNGPPRTDRSHL